MGNLVRMSNMPSYLTGTQIENRKTPSYLKEKLSLHRQPGNALNTFREICSRTERHSKTFFPDAIASWNIFISHFSNMPTFGMLKNHVTSFFRPKVKSIFGVHDPVGTHYLFQLRVGLSPLRCHKKTSQFHRYP